MYSLSAVMRNRARRTAEPSGISNDFQNRTVCRSRMFVSQIHEPMSLKLCDPRSSSESFNGSAGSSKLVLRVGWGSGQATCCPQADITPEPAKHAVNTHARIRPRPFGVRRIMRFKTGFSRSLRGNSRVCIASLMIPPYAHPPATSSSN